MESEPEAMTRCTGGALPPREVVVDVDTFFVPPQMGGAMPEAGLPTAPTESLPEKLSSPHQRFQPGCAESLSESSSSITDYRGSEGQQGVFQPWAYQLVSSSLFDGVIGLVIVANVVVVGMEQTYRLQGSSTTILDWAERAFLVVYIGELGLRLCATGLASFQDSWVRFDAVLVLVGVTEFLLLEIADLWTGELETLIVIRALRLLRLARAVRLLIIFRELWMLISGLLNSWRTMIYAFALLISLLYLFSCLSMEFITNHPLAVGPDPDEEFASIVESNFDSIPTTMLTLTQFITLDSINAIYRPLIMADKRLALYFATVIIVMGISCTNLITAVIVSSAMDQAQEDREMQKVQQDARRRKLVKEARCIFMRLDTDCSGTITFEELMRVTGTDRVVLNALGDCNDLAELFQALDIDRDGALDIDEFVEGITSVTLSKVPHQLKHVEKTCNSVFKRVKNMEAWQKRADTTLSCVLDELQQIRAGTLSCTLDELQQIRAGGQALRSTPQSPDVEPAAPVAGGADAAPEAALHCSTPRPGAAGEPACAGPGSSLPAVPPPRATWGQPSAPPAWSSRGSVPRRTPAPVERQSSGSTPPAWSSRGSEPRRTPAPVERQPSGGLPPRQDPRASDPSAAEDEGGPRVSGGSRPSISVVASNGSSGSRGAAAAAPRTTFSRRRGTNFPLGRQASAHDLGLRAAASYWSWRQTWGSRDSRRAAG